MTFTRLPRLKAIALCNLFMHQCVRIHI